MLTICCTFLSHYVNVISVGLWKCTHRC